MLAAVIGGIVLLLAIIVSMTMLTFTNKELPPALVNLFILIAGAFVASITGLLGHTLGFQNGTTNGEAQAQAQALRTVMHSEEAPHD